MAERAEVKRRRARPHRASRGTQSRYEALGPVSNPYPPFNILEEEGIRRIIDGAYRLLEEAGLEFRSQRALAILSQHGAEVDHASQIACMDRALVQHYVSLAPARFDVHARNPERDTVMGTNRINFNTVGSPPNVSDLERGRRPGTYQDLCDLIKLNHALGVIHLAGGAVVEPLDLPVPTRHLENIYALLRYTDRPIMARTISRFRAEDAIDMVAIARGKTREDIRGEPSVVTSFNTNSPRRVDEELLDGLMCFAEYGQVNMITPFTLAGAMAPVTVAGALVEQTAEALGVIAFAQMVNQGAPVMFGGFTSNVDMKSGAPAFGTPEYVKATLAGGQIARHFKLPYRASNVNASNAVDAQSTYESAMSLMACVLGHVHLVHHGLGWLEGGLTASFEKTVVDAEMIRAWAETLKPIAVDDDSLAVEAIKEVAPGGHFFGSSHTLSRYDTAFYAPMISDWRNYQAWEIDGAKTATQRAHETYKRLLADYEPPPIDQAIEEALGAHMRKRKEELKTLTM
ncbi:MAG TPA: trimethylamine methyltransferase family protein [Aestuariivirgaceae bacterium]|jgi:trimethylamine--corrinoid protein Co-methyltransferase